MSGKYAERYNVTDVSKFLGLPAMNARAVKRLAKLAGVEIVPVETKSGRKYRKLTRGEVKRLIQAWAIREEKRHKERARRQKGGSSDQSSDPLTQSPDPPL